MFGVFKYVLKFSIPCIFYQIYTAYFTNWLYKINYITY